MCPIEIFFGELFAITNGFASSDLRSILSIVKLHSVLIAEDNQDLRRTLKRGLEAEGYEVRVAANGAQALSLQRETPADILITDLFMPEADGFEAIAGFRRDF